LDRAFGKPREHPQEPTAPEEMSDQELEDRIIQYLMQGGLSERKAREVVRAQREAAYSSPASRKYLTAAE
jgi:hypothetical protein